MEGIGPKALSGFFSLHLHPRVNDPEIIVCRCFAYWQSNSESVRNCGLADLAIWDDGCGMGEKTLKEAMRFGADVSQEIERLGKFGLGLKLASL